MSRDAWLKILSDPVARSCADNPSQDALGYVTQLYNTKLTPDQKQQVDALKAQIQAGMAQKAESEASSVLGGFLGGEEVSFWIHPWYLLFPLHNKVSGDRHSHQVHDHQHSQDGSERNRHYKCAHRPAAERLLSRLTWLG